MAYALLFRNLPPERFRARTDSLRFDNRTAKEAALLARWLPKPLEAEGYAVRRALSEIGYAALGKALLLKAAVWPERAEFWQSISLVMEDCRAKDAPVEMKQLAIRGKDLFGLAEGPQIGEILQAALETVLEEPERNQRDRLMTLAKEMIEGKK